MCRPFSQHATSLARRQRGFTLIELLMSVAALAILATFALPAYSDYVRRGQSYEAFGALADYKARMDQYFQDNNQYGSSGACANDPIASKWSNFTPTDGRNFIYSCRSDDAHQRYTITAVGAAGNAVGQAFTIDQDGNRATTRFKGQPVDASCWLTKDSRC